MQRYTLLAKQRFFSKKRHLGYALYSIILSILPNSIKFLQKNKAKWLYIKIKLLPLHSQKREKPNLQRGVAQSG